MSLCPQPHTQPRLTQHIPRCVHMQNSVPFLALVCYAPGPRYCQALAGGDWFEVSIGLYDDSSNLKGCKVYRGNKMAGFTNDHFNIPSTGNYKLGFFAGSYDRTGGTVLGATLKVKAFQATTSA
jgi:acetamidase/formamidase